MNPRKSKHLRIRVIAVVTSVLALGVAGASEHPDGNSTAYRGWGATIVSETGYNCALYNPSGSRAGEIFFSDSGPIDVTLGGRVAHFTPTASGGFFFFHPLDEVTFPNLRDVPSEFKTANHEIMIVVSRAEIGFNIDVADPVTSLARSVSVMEIRCVYIVDMANPFKGVWCLNCLYVIS